ncbi:hypothetical protein [Moheibacter sediminis]|uniref:Uncharacterized protein n=1 Tax=Moheibacter sediminis TaxID=1434700 RepID=A0A1W2AR67_9FLAO|nr:hypothetical protein [Moheibacter sediminis]SMC63084.1 hypothetical protein SAMN06296427_10515 [Moheibacter sediminis]
MKKQICIAVALLMSGAALKAQVGINTENPQGILHVDGSADNPITGTPDAIQQSNDFVIMPEGKVGVGTVNPETKLHILGNSTDSPVIVDGLLNQSVTGSYANVIIDNNTGELYKGVTASKPFYYTKYTLSNVKMDWVANFDTKIDTNKYTVVVVGCSFNVGISTFFNSGNYFFQSQNVFSYKSGGTWRLTADFPNISTLQNLNGTWVIYVLIMENNQVTQLPDITVNMGGSENGSVPASPVP